MGMGVTEFIPMPSPYTARYYCDCGLVFEANTVEEAVRLHAEHQAEMRQATDHEGAPF